MLEIYSRVDGIPPSHLPSSFAEVDPKWIASREHHKNYRLFFFVIFSTPAKMAQPGIPAPGRNQATYHDPERKT
jgi:hypothetical protein